MENFEFKSSVCTSIEQSKRLLELGLKKETADCMYSVMTKSYNGRYILEEDRQYNLILFRQEEVQSVGFSHYEHIPAWSLHRIIELMPEVIFDALLCVFKDSIRYEALVFDRIEVLNDVVSDNMYDNAIATIEWLIKEGYFNKDYLEEKK